MAVYDPATGQYLVQPQANVAIGTVPPVPTSPTGVNLWLVGTSDLAQPQVVTTITSPNDVGTLLGNGTLAQAAMLCLDNPSPLVTTPPVIYCVDVDEKTQATGNIVNGANDQIALTSVPYGLAANMVKFLVSTASSGTGFKVTIASDYSSPVTGTPVAAVLDNIYQAAFSVYYTGTGTSPTVTVTDTAVTLTALTSNTGGTVTITATTTLQQLVTALNALPGWVVTLSSTANPQQLALAYLDNLTSTAVGTTSATAATVTATVSAAVAAINSSPVAAFLATAARSANATTLAVMTNYTYLTGGTTTLPTTTDWQNGFTMLEGVPGVGVVVPLTSTQAVWDIAEQHGIAMAAQNQFRAAIVGDAAGQSLATEQTAAAALGSPYTILRWPGFKALNLYGNLATLDPFYEAARTGAIVAASPITRSITMAPVTANGLETTVSKTTVDTAIQSGICITKPYRDGTFRIADDVTTYTATNTFNMRKLQVELELGVIAADLNDAVTAALVGYASNATPEAQGIATDIITKRLQYWANQNVLVGPTPFSNPVVSVANGVVTASVQVVVAQATDFVLLTLNPVPFGA